MVKIKYYFQLTRNSINFSVAVFIGIFFFHATTVLADNSGSRGITFIPGKYLIMSVSIHNDVPNPLETITAEFEFKL